MNRAAITVHRDRDEVERLWNSPEYRPERIVGSGATVTFKDAPGDRGTEIHVDLGDQGGKIGSLVKKIAGSEPPLSKVKEDLRRFKQHVETGVIPQSEGSPEGESVERKFKQRPAQPLSEEETEKAGV